MGSEWGAAAFAMATTVVVYMACVLLNEDRFGPFDPAVLGALLFLLGPVGMVAILAGRQVDPASRRREAARQARREAEWLADAPAREAARAARRAETDRISRELGETLAQREARERWRAEMEDEYWSNQK